MKPVNADLLRPWSRFLRISALGRSIEVPENNTLLRGLQSAFPDPISRGRFCWNNECGNCKVYYRLPGDPGDRKARGCCLVVQEEMALTQLSAELKFALRGILSREPDVPLPVSADAGTASDGPEGEEEAIPVPVFRSPRQP